MNQSEKQTFSKNERLCRLKLINEIFENGFVFFTRGFKVAWIFASDELPSQAQIAVSIPKKTFRQAVKRNLIRRRIKEAYRKEKHIFYKFLSEKDIKIAFILIYRLNSVPEYYTAENYTTEAIEKLCDNIRQKLKKC